MKFGSLITALVLVTSFTVVPAQAKKHGKDGDGHFDKIAKKLNLTSEQKAQLAEIKKAKREKNRELWQQMKTAMQELQQKMKSNASDEELRKTHEACQAARVAMGEARFESILAIRKILTPEQREKFGQFHKKFMGKRGHKWQGQDEDE